MCLGHTNGSTHGMDLKTILGFKLICLHSLPLEYQSRIKCQSFILLVYTNGSANGMGLKNNSKIVI